MRSLYLNVTIPEVFLYELHRTGNRTMKMSSLYPSVCYTWVCYIRVLLYLLLISTGRSIISIGVVGDFLTGLTVLSTLTWLWTLPGLSARDSWECLPGLKAREDSTGILVLRVAKNGLFWKAMMQWRLPPFWKYRKTCQIHTRNNIQVHVKLVLHSRHWKCYMFTKSWLSATCNLGKKEIKINTK